MKKSLYSLTLFDEVIERIDQLAYENRTNRSQLINDILAEHVGLETPEQKIQSVLEELDDNFSDVLSVSQIVKNNSIQFGKSLKYKYRPKIVYCFEFRRDDGAPYAEFKIRSRTKSEALVSHFDRFFGQINQIEKTRGRVSPDECASETGHKFVRRFKREGAVTRDEAALADFLTRYLKMIDTAMNAYFSVEGEGDIEATINTIYSDYFNN